MPSMVIHLAVGNQYVKNFEIKNYTDFRTGILKPDILGTKGKKEKMQAHYSDYPIEGATKFQSCFNKVNLYNYLTENEIKTDFDKGYFLHLLTDYYFFGYQIVRKPNFEKMRLEDLYPDYEIIAAEIKQQFDVDDSDTPWTGLYKTGELTILERQDVNDLIYVCSCIDLKDIEKQVKNNPNNWREVLNTQFEKVLSDRKTNK